MIYNSILILQRFFVCLFVFTYDDIKKLNTVSFMAFYICFHLIFCQI